MQWIKASEGNFPTVKQNYFLRHKYEDGRWHGWWSYIVPEAIDRDYWVKMGYEFLDESESLNPEQGIEAVFGELLNAAEMALAYLEFPSNEITRADYDQLKSAIQKSNLYKSVIKL